MAVAAWFVRGSCMGTPHRAGLRACAQRPHGLLAAARRTVVTAFVGRSGCGGGKAGGGTASTQARVAAAAAALLAGGLGGDALSSALSLWRSVARAETMLLHGGAVRGAQETATAGRLCLR